MSYFLPIIETFNKNDIVYVAVGGIAVILHGHTRLTTDIDFIIKLETENINRATKAISELGYIPKVPIKLADFANEEIRKSWISEKGMQVLGFTLPNNPLVSIDIFVKYPIDFNSLYKDSKEVNLDNSKIRICSINHLIEMKQIAGRAKDLEDIRILELLKNG